jgi:hypothetical protein
MTEVKKCTVWPYDRIGQSGTVVGVITVITIVTVVAVVGVVTVVAVCFYKFIQGGGIFFIV